MRINIYIGEALVGNREMGRKGFLLRARMAWGVFMGRYDVVVWDSKAIN